MALTSDEINFLIYRYLRESGFEHSAYAFGHESFIYKSSLESSSIPPGALISFVQKGLQYAEIETHVNDDGTETICEESFSIMKKHVCKPRPVKRKIFSAFDSLDSDYGQFEIDDARILRTDPDPLQQADAAGASSVVMRNMAVCLLFHPFVPVEKNSKKGNPFAEQQTGTLLTALADGTIKIWQWREEEEEEDEKKEEAAAGNKQPFQKGYVCVRTIPHPGLASSLLAAATSSTTEATTAAAASAATPVEPSTTTTAAAADETMTDASTAVTTDPTPSSSSSSSAAAEDSNKRQKLTDGSARDASATALTASPATPPCNLHSNHSIISVDWHPRGTHFASASYSGLAFIYSSKGELLHTLNKHSAPLTRIKFHPTGSLLLTASVDHTTCVWDVETGALKRQWHLHSGPVLDVDWCSVWAAQSAKSRDTTGPLATDPENAFKFASCSTDGRIFVVDVRDESKDGETAPAAAESSSSSSPAAPSTASKYAPVCLEGHEGEVNSISWDPSGTLLLSSSDDCSLKIWKASTGDILHDFIDHEKAVLTARWSGTGPCTEYPKSPLFVASGSADTTVKLFDPNNGRCLFTLTQHTHPVSIVAFAPRQQLLATASHERVFVWSLHSGSLIKTFKNLGDPLAHSASQMPIGRVGGLNDLAFDNRGEKIAVSYADGMTYVLDLLDSAIPAAASGSK